jgi:hypothetical protein
MGVRLHAYQPIHHKNSFRKKNPNGIMHMFFAHNTITIFLIEITTNKHFISYDNPLNYSLKYGITSEFGNFGSKVSFIAENPHLIESNYHESRLIINRKYSGCAVTDFWNFYAMGSSGKWVVD